MFQYSLGRHLALNNKTKLKLDLTNFKKDKLRKYELHVFNISANVASTLELFRAKNICSKILGIPFAVVTLKRLYFDKTVLKRKGNLYLDGYWQSEDYFKQIRRILLKEFQLKTKPDTQNKAIMKRIEDSNSVCIHLRRGDYINNPETRKVHGTCTLDYYLKAIQVVRKKVETPEFFVFSDDHKWARENLIINAPTHFVDINNPEQGYEDLRLMSLCKHFIIANSSFSWWAAWLSKHQDKIVCAPQKWFKSLDEGDVVPKEWVRVRSN